MFRTNKIVSVNPLYYVTFSTATLCASFILFSGFNTTDTINTLSLICGFLVTFAGVYLLNLSRTDPDGTRLSGQGTDAMGTDMVSSLQTRISMETRRSFGPSRRSIGSNAPDRQGLIRAYDEEEAGFGMNDLGEDSDVDNTLPMSPAHLQPGHANGSVKGKKKKSGSRASSGEFSKAGRR